MTKFLLKFILLLSIPFICGYSQSYGSKNFDTNNNFVQRVIKSNHYSNIGNGIKYEEVVFQSTTTKSSHNTTDSLFEESKTEENEINTSDFEVNYFKPILIEASNFVLNENTLSNKRIFYKAFAQLTFQEPLFVLFEVFRI